LGCHRPRSKAKAHDREVTTTSVGSLVQHDASLHQWSPLATEKWTLITSIDDYSRMLLFADFYPGETSWTHIQAVQSLIQVYGIPFRYYVNSLRVFRFVQGRDSFWRKHILQTDEVDTQWRQVMRVLGIEVTHALSPQAKGKVERPYRWLQDRIVRTCFYDQLSTIEEARQVLCEEVARYNHHQVHSTTGEIPSVRFRRSLEEGNSLFRPYSLPKPYTSPKDVFCLREKRITNGYRKISLFSQVIEVPWVPPREDVEIHLVPDLVRKAVEVRIWWQGWLVHADIFPMDKMGVRF
jgi:hypothetical protein